MLRGCTPYRALLVNRMPSRALSFYLSYKINNLMVFRITSTIHRIYDPGKLVFDTTSPMSHIGTIAFINCMDMRHNYLLIL